MNPPVVPGHLVWYADSFWRLSGDRPAGMGYGPIPFAAVDAYARRYGINETDAFDRFLSLIRVQDSEYIRIRNRNPDGKVIEEVTPEDTGGVKNLLERLASRSTESEQSQRLTLEEPDH